MTTTLTTALRLPIRQHQRTLLLSLLCLASSLAYGAERARQVAPVERPQQRAVPAAAQRLAEASSLVRAPEARAEFGVDGSGMTVAVLDTGLRMTHQDFSGRVAAQRNFSSSYGGSPDSASDDHGHGTNVAGIIAANGIHTGIAPNTRLVVLKVLNSSGSGSFTEIRNALQWVIDNRLTYGISAVNISISDGGNHTVAPSDPLVGLIQQLRAARVAVVCAAGNSYYTFNSQQGMGFPAVVPEAVSVGAVYDGNVGSVTYGSGAKAFTSGANRLAPFTQRLHSNAGGNARTDIFAPGAPVTSAGILNDTAESTQHGTSQATPVTVGILLLMQQLYLRQFGALPEVSLLEETLRSTAVQINDGDDEDDNVTNTNLSYLRADALAALRALGQSSNPSGPPQIVSQPAAQEVGEGQSATLSVVASGAAPLSYQWQKNGADLSGATGNVLTTSGLLGSDHGSSFRCVVRNGSGSATSNSAIVSVVAGGLVRLQNNVPASSSVALNQWKHFYIQVPADASELVIATSQSSADIDLYVRKSVLPSKSDWHFRPFLVSGDESVTVNAATNPALGADTWFCSVYGFQAANFTLTARHNGSLPNSAPSFSSGISCLPSPAQTGQALTFQTAASDPEGTALTYHWNFGDGAEADGPTASHTYSAAGTYHVSVVVSDGSATASTMLELEVQKPILPLTVGRLSMKLKFTARGQDSCKLSVSLDLPAEIGLEGASAVLQVGGVDFPFTLDSRGLARSAQGTLRAKGDTLVATLRNADWSALWQGAGSSGNQPKEQPVNVTVKFSLQIPGSESQQFAGNKELRLSSRSDRAGEVR